MDTANHIFADLATWFVDGPPADRDDVVFPNFLQRGRLDYSIDSLRAVDAYLGRIRGSAPENLATGRWMPTVVRTGAYVGEVIARSSPLVLNWYEFADYIAGLPDAVEWLGTERRLETQAVLASSDGKFKTAPHNKVCKFIWDGPEDSVWYYAKMMLDIVHMK